MALAISARAGIAHKNSEQRTEVVGFIAPEFTEARRVRAAEFVRLQVLSGNARCSCGGYW